jgi:quercetin dioxygenase-like cupin family protein
MTLSSGQIPSEDTLSGLILPQSPANRPVPEPEPGLEREILAYDSTMMLVRHRMRKGWVGAAHSHPHKQMVYVVSGHIRLSTAGPAGESTIDAAAGDSFIVEPGIEHQATALEDSVVLDIFTPAREDYL